MNNFLIRTLSGIAFAIIMTLSILWNSVSCAVIFGLILCIMMFEYMTISIPNEKNNTLGKILGCTAGVFFFFTMYLITGYHLTPIYLILTILPLLALYIGNLYIKPYNKHDNGDNGYGAFPFILSAFIYIAVPISMIWLVLFNQTGEYSGNILLSMLILLWCTDVGAYCAGSTLGKKFGHKLFISISPKKSWEGFWGGLLSTITGAIVLYYTNLLPINLYSAIILSVIICVFGVLGDLVESQLKRNFGVKDSGHIMPGHGGMLDRFDGALIAFPMAVIYLIFFAA